MFAQLPLLLLSATTLVSAQALHPAMHAARHGASIIARQASSTDDSATPTCLTAILSIVTTAPTPPPEIISWEKTASFTNPCSFSIPDSITAAFSSYSSEAVSWYNAHSSELFSVLSQCPSYSSIASKAGTLGGLCSTGGIGGVGGGQTTGAGLTTGAGATTTGAGQTTGTGAAASASKTPNAGHKEGGMVGAAVAAAGFLGVVAAL